MIFPNRITTQNGKWDNDPFSDFEDSEDWVLFISPASDGMCIDYIQYTFSEDGGDLILYLSHVHPDVIHQVVRSYSKGDQMQRVDI